MSFSLELRILLLKMSGIQKNDLRDLRGGSCAVNPATEPLSNQLGQQTTMVKMSVS
jgi:hypothetical protein